MKEDVIGKMKKKCDILMGVEFMKIDNLEDISDEEKEEREKLLRITENDIVEKLEGVKKRI